MEDEASMGMIDSALSLGASVIALRRQFVEGGFAPEVADHLCHHYFLWLLHRLDAEAGLEDEESPDSPTVQPMTMQDLLRMLSDPNS